MKNPKRISTLIAIFVSLPIWYYLLYKILVAVGGTELMFFLYWVYVPAGFIAGVFNSIAVKE